MVIHHEIGEYLYELFPAAQGKVEELPGVLADAYAVGPFKPRIVIEGDKVRIEIDEAAIAQQQSDYRKVVKLCEAGDYAKARPLLERLLVENPQVSEYHRILGQILSDLGENEKATDCLIDALRWDPRNQAALVMMANLQSRVRGQNPSALRYLREAHRLAPRDLTVLNNLGAMEMKAGNLDAARVHLENALKIKPGYPNSLFALACVDADTGFMERAIEGALAAISSHGKLDDFARQMLSHALTWAKQYAEGAGTSMLHGYAAKLEILGGKLIRFESGHSGASAAALQIAELHGRDHHLVKFRSDAPAKLHHQMHELVHLELALDARAQGRNCVIVSDGEHYAAFCKAMTSQIEALRNDGLPEDNLSGFLRSVFHGLIGLAYNGPIDLIIEMRLHQEFTKLRPVQFNSLHAFVLEGLNAVTDSVTIKHVTLEILSAVRVYNLSMAMLLAELFGISYIREFKPTATEKQRATMLLNEAKSLFREQTAGGEYKLILRFAELLGTRSYFQLVDEREHLTSLQSAEELLQAVESDPLGLDSDVVEKEHQTEAFERNQETIKKAMGLNMAVAHFMIEAIKHFRSLSIPEIQGIAMDCAMVGANGISPDKDGYLLKTVPGQSFTGNRLLAWFYASFAVAVPQMVSQIGLPFEKEWEWAKGEHSA